MVLIDIICMQIVISIGLEELKRWLSFKRVDCHTQIETSNIRINLLCLGSVMLTDIHISYTI